MKQADLIWMNGELVAWEDAKVHVLTHALHYGTGVFEGVRAYETPRGTAIFRHADHVERLFKSAGMYLMDIPYTREEIRAATHETIVRNGLRSCYIRPLVYRGAGPMGLFPLDCPVDVMIAVWEWGAYLGDEGKQRGVRGKVSSFRRISSDAVIPAAKATGQYVNSVLAKIEAVEGGLRGGDPARRPRHGLRGLGREPLRRQGRRDRDARASAPTSSAASTAPRPSRSPATSATRSSSATSRAASSTWPTRSS